MNKVINPGKIEDKYNVFVKISFADGRLSISGVEGPRRDGNCYGSCGQIQGEIKNWTPAEGWSQDMLNTLFFIWETYHPNDLTPNCQHMRDSGILNYTPGHVCPVCGYKSGSAWLTRDIPADVIKWLDSLPESTVIPAWV